MGNTRILLLVIFIFLIVFVRGVKLTVLDIEELTMEYCRSRGMKRVVRMEIEGNRTVLDATE